MIGPLRKQAYVWGQAVRQPAERVLLRLKWAPHWLPSVSIDALASGDRDEVEPILEDICMPPHRGTRDHDDFHPLVRLLRSRQPQIVLELGTGHGNLAANICRQCPSATVYTVNATAQQQSGKLVTYTLARDQIGRVYRAYGFADRVIQIFENTRTLDLRKYLGGRVIDLAIIDACHDTEYVMNDFTRVAPLMNKSSVVLFHDTHPSMKGHLKGSYLACLKLRSQGYDVRHIRGTWWAIWTPDWNKLSPVRQGMSRVFDLAVLRKPGLRGSRTKHIGAERL